MTGPEAETPAAPPAADAAPAPELESAKVPEVERALQEALAKANENFDLYVRAKAECENIRRRAAEDVARASKFAIESFAEALVPVADSLEKALQTEAATAEALREGAQLTLKQLLVAFEKGRLTPIDPAGQKFDPNFHQAISMVPAPEGVAPNHVVTVLQKGWKIADRVLRPALVTVAQG
ncbi:MAG: nucleotide exchange factor GrpE [Betaproteobacteria bacterium]